VFTRLRWLGGTERASVRFSWSGGEARRRQHSCGFSSSSWMAADQVWAADESYGGHAQFPERLGR